MYEMHLKNRKYAHMQSVITMETGIIGPNAENVSSTAWEMGMIYEFS